MLHIQHYFNPLLLVSFYSHDFSLFKALQFFMTILVSMLKLFHIWPRKSLSYLELFWQVSWTIPWFITDFRSYTVISLLLICPFKKHLPQTMLLLVKVCHGSNELPGTFQVSLCPRGAIVAGDLTDRKCLFCV